MRDRTLPDFVGDERTAGITKHVNYSRWQDDGEVERGGIVVAEVMIEDLQLVCGMPRSA